MSRSLELAWAAVFAALAIITATTGTISWPMGFALSMTVTLIVAIIEIRRPSYHGIGWQTINPGLPEWWSANAGPIRHG